MIGTFFFFFCQHKLAQIFCGLHNFIFPTKYFSVQLLNILLVIFQILLFRKNSIDLLFFRDVSWRDFTQYDHALYFNIPSFYSSYCFLCLYDLWCFAFFLIEHISHFRLLCLFFSQAVAKIFLYNSKKILCNTEQVKNHMVKILTQDF